MFCARQNKERAVKEERWAENPISQPIVLLIIYRIPQGCVDP